MTLFCGGRFLRLLVLIFIIYQYRQIIWVWQLGLPLQGNLDGYPQHVTLFGGEGLISEIFGINIQQLLIFYRLLKDITQFTNHHSVQHKKDGLKYYWDRLIVDWCNSVLYLGGKRTLGKRTFNFLRGPVNFQRGKSSSFSLTTYNLPLPDKRTCRRPASGYTRAWHNHRITQLFCKTDNGNCSSPCV